LFHKNGDDENEEDIVMEDDIDDCRIEIEDYWKPRLFDIAKATQFSIYHQ
jgi:hypothetical protein